ncbi:MAG: tRNA (adenosine(37)-N6)-threonylcarbamoyltransferase complex dimerization subunit type 1 TsaB [Calditrichaeota bacterium]|nr:MAG: tRNA (adenosine(37)-N6)-threonylcarbamoyltransferase complex dimerization subunit type 1 TsaB [Calditrichota bacterium]
MLVLGIETATPTCAVAVWGNGQLVAEQRVKLKNMHAEIIAGMIRQVVQQARCSLEQMSCIAVSKGPGSFTGLRIGLAMAKGIAFARNLPIVGIATLDAIASGIAPVADRIVVALPSRRGEIFAAPYRNLDGQYQREGKITALPIADFRQWSRNIEWVAGPGIAALKEFGIRDKLYLPEIFWEISAAPVARLGARRFLAGEMQDLASLEPEYIKPFYTSAKPKAVTKEAC